MAANPSTQAMMIEDDKGRASSVVSQLDASSARSGARIEVNPETKLKALFEITHNLGSVISLEDVLSKILDSLFKIFLSADRGIILLRANEKSPLIPKAVAPLPGPHEH